MKSWVQELKFASDMLLYDVFLFKNCLVFNRTQRGCDQDRFRFFFNPRLILTVKIVYEIARAISRRNEEIDGFADKLISQTT